MQYGNEYQQLDFTMACEMLKQTEAYYCYSEDGSGSGTPIEYIDSEEYYTAKSEDTSFKSTVN